MQKSIPNGAGEDERVEDGDTLNLSDDSSGDENSEIDDPSIAEGSDDEGLVSLDGLLEFDGPDEDEDVGGWDGHDTKKRKHTGGKSSRKRTRISLPTFASYEEYADMIDNGP